MTQFPLRPLVALLAGLLATNAIASDYAVTYSYNEAGQVSTIDGPRDDVADITRYDYDANGNLSRITNALGHYREFLDYNAQGKPERLVDENGVETLLGYTAQGQLASIRQGAAETSFSYDDIGQLIGVSLPTGLSLTYSYDDARRLTTVTRSSGEQLRYDYDAMGNVIGQQLQDADGNSLSSQSYRYDELGRLLAVIGSSFEISYSYTANSQREGQVDGRGNPSSQSHDALGRVVSQVNEMAHTVGFGYDSGDNLTRVTDARGNSTQYQRDHLGRVTQLTSPDTGVTSYSYDSAGNLSYRRDARGIDATLSYDPLNRLSSVLYVSAPADSLSYRYDEGSNGLGRLTGVDNGTAQLSFGYQPTGQLASQTSRYLGSLPVAEHGVSYSYTDAGQLAAVSYPNGLVVNYRYDDQGQLTTIDSSGLTTATLASDIRWQPFGQGLASLRYGNNIAGSWQQDSDGRLASISYSGLERYGFSYDGNSNITAISRDVAVTDSQSFNYDPANRLVDEQTVNGGVTYSYDANGNRINLRWMTVKEGVTKSGVEPQTFASTSNRQTSHQWQAVAQDAAGNTISTEKGLKTFNYNAEGRYREYYYNGLLKTRYGYNGLGQRVMKQEFNPTGTLKETTLFVYGQQGQLLFEQSYQPNGKAKESRSYVWLGLQPLAMVRQAFTSTGVAITPERYFLHLDHLATPRLMTNSSGTLVWRWRSSAFGSGSDERDVDGDGKLLTMPLRFPGQYYDLETGLHYNYYRDYNPRTGRYIQSDPIGLAGGMNTYGYVGGNPVSYYDIFGLAKLPNGPSGLGDGWSQDHGHRHPNGEKWDHESGTSVEWHPGQPGKPGWGGKDHWHVNGGKQHLPPGTDVPEFPGNDDEAEGGQCGEDSACRTVATTIVVGGTAYWVYRCVRMVPSLFPPLWSTIPANVAIP